MDKEELQQALLIARANAINRYAGLEEALSLLLGIAGKMPESSAATIFYRIGAHQRRLVLDALIRQTFDTKYAPYWPHALKAVRNIDNTRNNIVHWHVYLEEIGGFSALGLRPTPFEHRSGHSASLSIRDLNAFSIECHYWSHCLMLFGQYLEDKLTRHPRHAAWIDTFQRPAAYPPTAPHPLFQVFQSREGPPEP